MSNRREEDPRPSASAISQRATLRDVPAAKYKDGAAGTVAPRGLRGPSLLPGQGAPERIIPEEVELAVLRDAETLDGPKVARAVVGNRPPTPDSRPLAPTAVSVEVPRVRSMPPVQGEYASTPPTPSARSIQSGTLMSIGSVDPRAPTELSLPGPRPLSVAERAAYLGPEAVVDRTPPSLRRGPLDDASVTQRPGAPVAQPLPQPNPRLASPRGGNPPSVIPPAVHAPSVNPRSVISPSASPRSAEPASVNPVNVGVRSAQPASVKPPSASPRRAAPPSVTPPTVSPPSVSPPRSPTSLSPPSVSPPSATAPGVSRRSVPAGPASVRPSLKPDSVAPPAQNFARVPRSYSPVSLSPIATPMRPPRPTSTPMRPPRPTPKPPRPEAAPSVPPPASSGLAAPPQYQIHSEVDAVPHEVQEDTFDLRSVSTQREPLASRKVQASADWTAHGPISVPPSEVERSVRSNRSSSPAVTILVDRTRESAPAASERPSPMRAAVPLSWVLGAAAFAVIVALIVAFAMRPSAPPRAAVPLDGRASAAAPSTAEPAPPDATPPIAPGTKRPGVSSAGRPANAAPKPAARAAISAAASASAAPSASVDPGSKAHQSIY